jgi:hypothetical protein
MKKSSLIVITGILIAMITLAAADLKVKKEYDANNIKEYLIYKALPPFHYIKDNYTGKQVYEWYICNIRSANKSGVGMDFRAELLFDFVVKNDTLFIQKPAFSTFTDIAYGIPLTIFTAPLKGVVARSCWMNIDGKMADSISAIASNKADIKFDHLTTKALRIEADNTSKVSISGTDSLKNLYVQLRSTSSFSANNVFISNKYLQMTDSASLRLSGRSLENFGVKKY